MTGSGTCSPVSGQRTLTQSLVSKAELMDGVSQPGTSDSQMKADTQVTLGGFAGNAGESARADVHSMDDRSHEAQLGPLGIHIHHPNEFSHRRRSSAKSRRRSSSQRRASASPLYPVTTNRRWWKFHLREWDDDNEQDWWFASTAIPLLAATLGPLANVLSIAALVTYWRMCLVPGVTNQDEAKICAWNGTDAGIGPELQGVTLRDPRWCYWLNVVSLIVGFIGNFFLLCNFTNRIRYIVALPVTIVLWYVATGILIGITVAMEIYVPPARPAQTYSQGFWYAVMAACLYMICAMLLMVNMLGYFLGHYPQHFTLTESQRTLILQTMLFFIWLAGGAAVFSQVESHQGNGEFGWSYVNSLYYCDVTILTVGFGDLFPTSNTGRGLVFPYSVGGIIMLGLMVSSITKFAAELGSEKVIHRHIENTRVRTIGRTVTTSLEMEHRQALQDGERPRISAPISAVNRTKPQTINFVDDDEIWKEVPDHTRPARMPTLKKVSSWVVQQPIRRGTRKPKLILLREEKDRFDAMRRIQHNTSRYKAWYALFASVMAFGLLWAGGAAVFYLCERNTQQMTYFQGLYFCYVSLLTIGYGDLSPRSNAGRPFFVFWSLIAVPTMTILVSDLGDTVINKFKSGTDGLANFTVLPQRGVWRDVLNRYPWLLAWLQNRKERRDAKKRLEEGFKIGPAPEPPAIPLTIDDLAEENPSEEELARKLSTVIRRVATQARVDPSKKYSYEEWVEFTQLIRFTALASGEREAEEEEEGMVEWDWIGEDSPMMARKSEAEFVLDRLCESMNRYIKRVNTGKFGKKTSEDKCNAEADIETYLERKTSQRLDYNDELGPRDVRQRETGNLHGETDGSSSSSFTRHAHQGEAEKG